MEDTTKISNRIGVTLVASILFVTGILLINQTDKKIEFIEGSVEEATVTNKVPVSKKPSLESSAGLININSASLEDLDTLSGIGEKTAQKIIEYRTEHGGFKSIDEIKEVVGIGEAKFEKIKNMIKI